MRSRGPGSRMFYCLGWVVRASVRRSSRRPSAQNPATRNSTSSTRRIPRQIRRFEANIDLAADALPGIEQIRQHARTPISSKITFTSAPSRWPAAAEAPKRFVAITDPGSSLEKKWR